MLLFAEFLHLAVCEPVFTNGNAIALVKPAANTVEPLSLSQHFDSQ